MTVYDNMGFGLKMARATKVEIDQKARHAAEMLQLTSLLDRLPKLLSGGQRQRAPIGRAITRDPNCSCSMNLCPTSTRPFAWQHGLRLPD